MEQQLINELIKLLCKGGGETLVGNFQKDTTNDGCVERWSSAEVEEAVQYIRYINEYFGKEEAVAVITSLAAKYNVDLKGLSISAVPPEKLGIAGR